MATGDSSDILSRLKQLFPGGWFTQGSVPLRDALLQGAATGLAFAYSALAYVRLQTRIGTATDGFLDLIALDYFGTALSRAAGQTDASFRARILSALFQERGTRAALIAALKTLTGRTPAVVEVMRPADTGSYGGPLCGYGVAGAYGSMLLPFQCFVKVYRPAGVGIPLVAGYGIPSGGYSTPSRAAYASILQMQGSILDADIYAAIETVRPEATTVWTAISS
jgi:hypothetical protein